MILNFVFSPSNNCQSLINLLSISMMNHFKVDHIKILKTSFELLDK